MGFKPDPAKNIVQNQLNMMYSTFVSHCKFKDAHLHKPHGTHTGNYHTIKCFISEQTKLKVSIHMHSED